MNIEQMIAKRTQLFGPNNPIFYEKPLHLVKGDGVWLTDADGKKYLDCYNNVPTVGHCHPHVVEALYNQAKELNTHTRYLHDNILQYAERLLSTYDDSLNRLVLTCTGSEANELALRLIRNLTGGQGVICTNATYHGNTAAVAQLSSIFEPAEGYGPHIRTVRWPDQYRTPDMTDVQTLTDIYLDDIRQAIQSLKEAGIPFAGMILCPIYANEGLPNIPEGYLEQATKIVRDAGGLIIADEVQAGFGRTGKMWGHQSTGFVPDIATMGKPMGNGHPLAGLVARDELVDRFREKDMYFNTFGGNPVSCAVGNAVLDVLENENLISNAASTGEYVLSGLRKLAKKHSIIGDVRGKGLFFGVDLVKDHISKEPAVEETRKLINDMKEHGILISSIGEFNNVLKIRPPLPFNKENAELLLEGINHCLSRL